MSKSKEKTKTKEQVQVTPTPDSRLLGGVHGLQGMIDNLRGQDPGQFVAPASPLQNKAFNYAGLLGDRMSGGVSGKGGGTNVMRPYQGGVPGVPANSASGGLAGPNPANLFSRAGLLANTAGSAPANTVDTAFLSTPGILGNASGYDVSGPANVTGMTASGPAGVERIAATGPAGVSNVDVSQGAANTIDLDALRGRSVANASPESLLTGFDRYMNPALESVVEASLANYDRESGKRQAALAARAAGDRKFGGSRFGVAEGEFQAVEALKRGLLESGLRSDAFDTAANLSNLDANRRQQASMYNASAANDAAGQEYGLYGNSLLSNLGAENQFGLANMDATNLANRQNADASNIAARDFAARSDAANSFNADAFNRSQMDYASRSDTASARNADAYNRSALDYAARSDDASRFGADASNRFDLSRFDADTQANFRNADAVNNMNRFNAGQQDAALARQLQSAGLLSNLGATVGSEDRANIGLLAALGEQQRDIDSAYRNAAPTMAQLIAALQGSQPIGVLTGSNQVGESTSSTTRRGSLLDTAGGLISLGTQAMKFG